MSEPRENRPDDRIFTQEARDEIERNRQVLLDALNEPRLTRAEWEATAIMVICKHNTPDALTTSLFLSPMDGEQIPEGEYALVRVGDREDS